MNADYENTVDSTDSIAHAGSGSGGKYSCPQRDVSKKETDRQQEGNTEPESVEEQKFNRSWDKQMQEIREALEDLRDELKVAGDEIKSLREELSKDEKVDGAWAQECARAAAVKYNESFRETIAEFREAREAEAKEELERYFTAGKGKETQEFQNELSRFTERLENLERSLTKTEVDFKNMMSKRKEGYEESLNRIEESGIKALQEKSDGIVKMLQEVTAAEESVFKKKILLYGTAGAVIILVILLLIIVLKVFGV